VKQKQRLMKIRMMPVKCPSEDSDQCTAKDIENSDLDHIEEVDSEDKFEAAKKEMLREKRFKKQENIESIHLFSSFNYWMPIEMKFKQVVKEKEKKKKDEAEGEGEGESENGESEHEPEHEDPLFSF
jgi:hypothetical protein